jgi:hypothetical protein
MCGSSLFGGTGSNPFAQQYPASPTLTYQNGQWTNNGTPVNPGGGIVGGPAAGGAVMGAPAGAAQPPAPSSPPFGTPQQIMMNMAKGMQLPANAGVGMAGQQNMPVTPAGAPINGGGTPQLAMLVKALLSKGA